MVGRNGVARGKIGTVTDPLEKGLFWARVVGVARRRPQRALQNDPGTALGGESEEGSW